MKKSKKGPEMQVEGPLNVEKRSKRIKVTYSGQALSDVERRAREAGYGGVGPYLKAMELQRAELLELRRAAVLEVAGKIRQFRLSRKDFEAVGLMI